MRYILIFLLSIPYAALSQERFTITHGPFLQHLSKDGVTIVWTTNKDAISWIELAPDDSSHFYLEERPKFYSADYGFKEVAKVHRVRLNNLRPAVKYRYRVYSQEVLEYEGSNVKYGDVAATAIYRSRPLEFATLDPLKEDISFLVVNDIHGNNELLENLLEKGDYKTKDLIFFNGDMVNLLRSEEQMFGDFMDTATRLFAKEMPMYYARGNHETRGNYAHKFQEYFAAPSGKLYYLLRQGPVCFVVLDCGEDKPDSDIEYSGIAAFDQYRDAEKEWLQEALKSPEFSEAPLKIAVIHMPPFGGWHGEEEVKTKFIPLLNDAGIDVMFCGHLHRYIRQEPQPWINFPVIVNRNNTVVSAHTTDGRLMIRVIDENGIVVDELAIGR